MLCLIVDLKADHIRMGSRMVQQCPNHLFTGLQIRFTGNIIDLTVAVALLSVLCLDHYSGILSDKPRRYCICGGSDDHLQLIPGSRSQNPVDPGKIEFPL